ncbi:MAG TPA: helix-turn-helix domain-containing protein [Candidatus Dormibacteraeota bacterium]|nr:helix-turn-helix domain-containing protein [Candidatus Dormibacteraeota bacterium]
MSQLFSTDLLPASDRIDAWQWNAQQICGDCRIRLPKTSFHGSIEIRNIAGLPLTRFSSSALSFWKWPFDSASAQNRSCLVITQIAGTRHYLQGGKEIQLKAGDSTIIDTSIPWSSSCDSDCVRLYLRVPRWMMQDRLRMDEIPMTQKIGGATAPGAILSRLSQNLYEEATWMNGEELTGALDHYFDVLTACTGGETARAATLPELKARILRFVDVHLGEQTLSPSAIAEAIGISVRHLHRVFSVTGSTVGDYIRVLRLDQCRKDLVDPRLRDKSITEIAFARGFSDAAHFSHSFRKQFGISARTFRTQLATREQVTPRDGNQVLRAKIFDAGEASLN